MNSVTNELEWSLVQTFLAVAEEGSLSAAARRLKISQPTAGRHVQTLEEQLGILLFRRKSRGFELTEVGIELLPVARSMRVAASTLARISAGQGTAVAGTVRLTTSQFMAHYVLPEIIVELRQNEPQIVIDLLAADTTDNLLFGEADVAVRMYRSTQLDVVTKYLGEMSLGLFAAKSYLDRRGRPQNIEALINEHDLIGYDQDDRIVRGMQEMGLAVTRDWFTIRCDNHPAYWQLLRAGGGVGFSQVHIGDLDSTVERLFPELPLPPLPVWLATHKAMRQSPRVRRVWDALVNGLAPFLN